MRSEHEIVIQVRKAQLNSEAADSLIRQYMPFIRSETAKFTGRVPAEGYDDELSIAMFAFYEAVMAYSDGRGAFLKFAATSIKNRLIDYRRKENRHSGLKSLEEPVGDEEGQTLLDTTDTGRDEIDDFASQQSAKAEMELFATDLKEFGIELSEVADNCPKQNRSLKKCIQALEYAKQHKTLLDQMVSSKKLPIAELAKGAKVEKKTLERHRKYMIAILLAYTNGFEIIRGHLSQM